MLLFKIKIDVNIEVNLVCLICLPFNQIISILKCNIFHVFEKLYWNY